MAPHTNRPTITLHMVSSLDGVIARPDNSVSWLESPADLYPQGVAEGYVGEGVPTIDCFLMGSHTYEHALELGWPYGSTPVIVLTSRALRTRRNTVDSYAGDLEKLVDELLASRYANVWLVGGAMLCQSFLALDLVDEIRLTIAPVLLGHGLHLFSDSASETRWRLRNATAYKTAFVELHYAKFSSQAP